MLALLLLVDAVIVATIVVQWRTIRHLRAARDSLNVGTVSVKVIPDTSEFERQLRRAAGRFR